MQTVPDQGHGGAVQRNTDGTLEHISSADQDVSDEPNQESRDSSDPVWEAIEASFSLIDSDDHSGARANRVSPLVASGRFSPIASACLE
jgi:hypothetical protein